MDNTIHTGVPSLISRNESTSIKGLIILLVVYGHTEMFNPNYASGDRTFLYDWFYSFHVYIFYILPFIYGAKDVLCLHGNKVISDLKAEKKEIEHVFVKIVVPYFWFFVISAFIFILVGKGVFNPIGMLYAFFFGEEALIDRYIGFDFMWFLPAMFALLSLKSIWYHSANIVRWVIIIVSVILWSLIIFKVFARGQIGMCIPFALSQGFCFIIYGLVSRWIIERQIPRVLLVLTSVILIIILSFTLWGGVNLITIKFINVDVPYVRRLIMPIAVFLLLYYYRNTIAKSKFLCLIGKFSMQIYLVHVFVINTLFVLCKHFIEPNLGLRVVVYILATATSLGIAVLITKNPKVNKVLFPKG